MSKYKNRTFTLRIDNILQDKVKIIAEREDRPVTSQYERIVRNYIETYEAEHGEIQLDDQGGGVTNCLTISLQFDQIGAGRRGIIRIVSEYRTIFTAYPGRTP